MRERNIEAENYRHMKSKWSENKWVAMKYNLHAESMQ
jgi:hypothetical protein